MTQLLTRNQPSTEAINWFTSRLIQAGLKVSRSFDLRTAMTESTPCTCQHHANNCDCDLVVLLVYGTERHPATIVAHSHNGRTWFSLSDNPGDRPSSEIDLKVRTALTIP
jgi:hypothetical protein